MSNESRLTRKQFRILSVVLEGNKDAEGTWTPVDIDELLERLSYRTSKQSFHYSMRALVNRDLVTRGSVVRRGARRVTLEPTVKCKQLMTAHSTGQSFIEPQPLSAELDFDL